MRNFHTVFHSSCTNLHFFWWFTRVLFSPHSYTHLFIACLFDDSYSKRDEVLYHCGLICIYLMIIDAEHLFLLAICISSLEKCLFNSSAHFKMGFLFLLLRSMSFSYILDINPYQMCDCECFLPSHRILNFIKCMICECFLPFHRLPFHFAEDF